MAADKRRTRGAPRPAEPLYDDRPLSSRLHDLQHTRQLHLNRRDTLLDMVRAVHTTLDPEQIAGAVVGRTASWLPLTCWLIVAGDAQRQLGVLACHGAAMGLDRAACAVGEWVIAHGEAFTSGDVSVDARVAADYPGAA